MIPFPEQAFFAARTLFGRGTLSRLPALCRDFGSRGLVVHGASLRQTGHLETLRQAFGAGVSFREHAGGEPTLDQADALRAAAREAVADWVVGIGGGSVLDLAKTAAGLFHEADPTGVFHAGKPPARPGLPFIAVPTTAGTGAEATPNAVLTDTATDLKKSIRDDRYMARAVILDSSLLAGAPPAVIAHAGMDAYTQALEAAISIKGNAWSEATALTAIRLISQSLPQVYFNSSAPEADSLMAGSHLAGIALAQARLGVVHGLAHPLGAFYHQPHGLVCAACLPGAIELNRAAMGDRYRSLSEAVGGDLADVTNLHLAALGIRNPFKGQPLVRKHEIVEQTLTSGSTQANPKKVTPADVDFLLGRLFG